MTPASSLWRQLCVPGACLMQSANERSSPLHFTLSTWMGPDPSPKYAITRAFATPLGRRYRAQNTQTFHCYFLVNHMKLGNNFRTVKKVVHIEAGYKTNCKYIGKNKFKSNKIEFTKSKTSVKKSEGI